MDAPDSPPQASRPHSGSGGVPQSQTEHQPPKNPSPANTASSVEVPMTRNRDTTIPMYRTQMCRNFMLRNRCKFGDNCIFSHGIGGTGRNRYDRAKSVHDENVSDNRNMESKIGPKKGVCHHFFYKGKCPYGESCVFLHQGPEKSEDLPRESSAISIETVDFESKTNPRLKTRLCRRWMMHNNCPSGDNCAYAHGQAELRQSSLALASEPGSARTAPRTSQKDALALPSGSNAGEQQEVSSSSCKWKTGKKIAGIYGDWIDEA